MSERPPKVWFYRPRWHWFGWATLLPWYFGGDEYDRRTLMLGWAITGRVVFPLPDNIEWV
jgi:hypothetical protein